MPLTDEEKKSLAPKMANLFRQPGGGESVVRIASDILDGNAPATDEDKKLLTLMIQFAFNKDVAGEDLMNAILGRDLVKQAGFSVDDALNLAAAAAQYRLGLAITGKPGPSVVRRIIPMLVELSR